jgi:hypothetical protein
MEIQSISLVSSLQWNSINKECLICNNPIGSDCIKCEEKIKNNGSCMSIMNKNPECRHSFHEHCLKKYHQNNNLKCAMCNYQWLG